MPFTDEAREYFDFSPLSADAADLTPETFRTRVSFVRALPENLRRTLIGAHTVERIAGIARMHRLSREQARGISAALGRILRGEERAGSLAELLRQGVDAPHGALEDVARTLTAEFITPNYFQITQVYEKRNKSAGQAPLRQGSAGQGRQQGTAAPATHVVDLRNGAIPSRLPPLALPLRASRFAGQARSPDESGVGPAKPVVPAPPSTSPPPQRQPTPGTVGWATKPFQPRPPAPPSSPPAPAPSTPPQPTPPAAPPPRPAPPPPPPRESSEEAEWGPPRDTPTGAEGGKLNGTPLEHIRPAPPPPAP